MRTCSSWTNDVKNESDYFRWNKEIFVYMLIGNNRLCFRVQPFLFSKHKQILMSYQQKVVFYAICFPITCRTAVVLFLDDKLFEGNYIFNFRYYSM